VRYSRAERALITHDGFVRARVFGDFIREGRRRRRRRERERREEEDEQARNVDHFFYRALTKWGKFVTFQKVMNDSGKKDDDVDRKLRRLRDAIAAYLGNSIESSSSSKKCCYSRYEIRKLWPFSEREVSFAETTRLLLESCSSRDERRVDVEKLVENVERYFARCADYANNDVDESSPINASAIISARDVFEAEENASLAESRGRVIREQRLQKQLRCELNRAKKEKERAMEDISNRTEQNEEYVRQVHKHVEDAMRKATEMEEQRDLLRARCEALEKENRMLRNGERYELLREKMIVRETKLREKLEDALKMIEVLRLEGIEKDAELIRNRERRTVEKIR
jgi:hypothetical protein